MPNSISEYDIEVAMVQRLQHVYGYDTLNCYTTDPADFDDSSGGIERYLLGAHLWLKNSDLFNVRQHFDERLNF